jgi:hypothetical protein
MRTGIQAFLILSFILSGVKLSPLGTAPTIGLLYQPQMIDDGDCGAIVGMKIGRGDRNTRRKPAAAPRCPPQIPHYQTRARSWAAAVGSQRLTAWAMTRPTSIPWVGFEPMIPVTERAKIFLASDRAPTVIGKVLPKFPVEINFAEWHSSSDSVWRDSNKNQNMQPGNGHQLMFELDNYERQNGCSTAGTRDIGNIASICSFSYLCFETNVVQTLRIMLRPLSYARV